MKQSGAAQMKALLVVISLLLGVTAFGPTPAVAASIIYVPGSYPTIQQAIDAANAGDVIRVSPGTYGERLDFDGKDVILESVGGAEVTTIDAGFAGTAVEIGPNGVLRGFTVTGGVGSPGGGARTFGLGSLIEDNRFVDNRQTSGGFGAAIGGNGSSPTIMRNWFENNSCGNQGLSGVVSLVNGSSPRIDNNVFFDNPCRGVNMTLPTSAKPVVVNNTFVDNRVGIRVDRRTDNTGQVYRNNLIYRNGIGVDIPYGVPANNPVWTTNLVAGNTTDYDTPDGPPGTSDITAEPLFVSVNSANFRAFGASPAIDAGTLADAPSIDLLGVERPQDGDGSDGAAPDIGAYEYVRCGTRFIDVGQEHPFCNEIAWMGDDGLSYGWPDGTFRPTVSASRQALAAFIYREAGAPAFLPPSSPTFSDVPPANPFYLEIEWMVANGFANGFSDGSFRPGVAVMRQALVAILWRFAGSPPGPFPDPGFADVDGSNPFYPAIAWAFDAGVGEGFPDGTFRPVSPLTRQALSAFFWRAQIVGWVVGAASSGESVSPLLDPAPSASSPAFLTDAAGMTTVSR